MPTQLSIHATSEGGLRMTATNGAHTVKTDYPVKPGETATGLKPMELLLVSLGTCGGSVVGSLLTKMNQPATGVEVDVRGERRDEHPTIFTSIAVEFIVRGRGVQPAAVERAIAQADSLCPVWAMLKPATTIKTAFKIVEE